MIILATVIILTLDSSNIIERANEAKEATNLANAKEIVALAKAEWELDKEELLKEYADVTEYAYSKLEEAGYKIEGNGAISLSETSSAINTIYVGSDDRQAIIPEGFKVSSVATEDTVTEGLVIIDEEGNEFVWVPVDDFTKFQRTTTYDGTITAPSSEYVEPLTASTPHVADISLYADEIEEYNNMRASVQTNKGFYIARYEAGLPEGKTNDTAKLTDKPVSKKNVTPWERVDWDSTCSFDADNEVWSPEYGFSSNPGAAFMAKNMYSNSNSVGSTLCYGVQWDSTLQYIYNTDADYPTNSENKGNHSGIVEKTGYYAVNNIYDMAGNVMEWTMEACSNFSNIVEWGVRVFRGADYNLSGVDFPAAFRAGNELYDGLGYTGFRVTLYLK